VLKNKKWIIDFLDETLENGVDGVDFVDSIGNKYIHLCTQLKCYEKLDMI
jgi:hypothetical protein